MLQELTHSEKLVMKAIWEIDRETGLSEILEHVNERFQKDWKPQTVSTFLGKLVRKDYLILKRRGKDWLYEIRATSAEYQKQEMKKLLQFWGGTDIGKTLLDLCKDKEMTNEERAELRRVFDELRNAIII